MQKGRSPDILTKASAVWGLFSAHLWVSLALSAVLGRLLDGASAKRCCVSTPVSRPLHRPCSFRARPSQLLLAMLDPTHVLVKGRLQAVDQVRQSLWLQPAACRTCRQLCSLRSSLAGCLSPPPAVQEASPGGRTHQLPQAHSKGSQSLCVHAPMPGSWRPQGWHL